MVKRRHFWLWVSWYAAALLPACDVANAPKAGQSGSEYEPADPSLPVHEAVEPGVPDSPAYLPCPCERLAGKLPLAGRVLRWEATLLELEVEQVLLSVPPAGAPQAGDRVTGAFNGRLPCYAGKYEPAPGDRVLAYLAPEEQAPMICCDGCAEQCDPRGPDAGTGVYSATGEEAELWSECVAECQRSAGEACATARAKLNIAGVMYAGPLADGVAVLARSEGGTHSFSVGTAHLDLVFDGGSACMDSLVDIDAWALDIERQAQAGDAGAGEPSPYPVRKGGMWNWRPSCP